jgi:hypothetical protein
MNEEEIPNCTFSLFSKVARDQISQLILDAISKLQDVLFIFVGM